MADKYLSHRRIHAAYACIPRLYAQSDDLSQSLIHPFFFFFPKSIPFANTQSSIIHSLFHALCTKPPSSTLLVFSTILCRSSNSTLSTKPNELARFRPKPARRIQTYPCTTSLAHQLSCRIASISSAQVTPAGKHQNQEHVNCNSRPGVLHQHAFSDGALASPSPASSISHGCT